MSLSPAARSAAAIAAATAMNLPFGTIYAFSVFLKPMESALGVSRAEMSFVFGLAACSLTLWMNLTPWLYRRFSPVLIAALGGVGSAAGLVITAFASGFLELVIGYGLLFGIGGGAGFILVQQGVNQTVRSRIGLVNGYVIGLYPLGAMIGAPLFGWAITAWGLRETLLALALTVLLACLLTAFLFRIADIRMHDASPEAGGDVDRRWPLFFRLFAVFFLAAAAGLTVMSQAAGIIAAYGAGSVLALGGTSVITGFIAAARIGGGWLVDRLAVPHVAAGAHAFSLCGAVLLSLWPGPALAVPALIMIGMGYGFISGITAGAIGGYWSRNAFGRVASQLYIAWCVAAISLPVLAGWIYDRTQGYGMAVMIAAAGNLLGIVLSLGLPRHRRTTG